MADKDRAEHQPVRLIPDLDSAVPVNSNKKPSGERSLEKFRILKPTSPDFMPALEAVMSDLTPHI